MINEFKGETRWLSNFYYSEIDYQGITYPSTEHAYQASKSDNEKIKKIFSILPKCSQTQILGNNIKIRDDWEQIKLTVMEDVIRLKFLDETLKKLLIDTGDQELIEGNHWNDTFWGVCDGVGENHLGKILMKIRQEIKNG